ncbi:AlpA family transcriptional regulator [Aeromonas sp. PrichA-15]|uniref:helix-turn-helix transcriptional regulator n=1 Tax=Aeromonas sp. PrichA-15 TaxID=2823360 RepID=UPI001B33A1FC|nr:AlpA family transcriptional regulator [Aeromonas sp. PrichA-15]MBP4033279.1 AlpA family transcriptional regulator [Aeromonas sp. PrichA-15]
MNTPNTAATVAARLIRIREVMNKTGLSKSGVYDLMNAGQFPKSIRLSDTGRTVAFIEAEVDSWIAARIVARKAA